ncbi:hypothetical protein E4T43_08953 [Aureobasidium subglaciale]|nr:hypothetical protein E4T43_08953 [Aureobasidium subglaciale]
MDAITNLEVSNLHVQDTWFEAMEPLTLTEACQIGRETRASSIEEFDESEFEQNPFPFVGERALMPNMLSSLIDMDKRGSSSDESGSTNNSNSSISSSVSKRVAKKVVRSFFTLMLCGSTGDSTTSSTQAAPLHSSRPTTLKGLDLYYPPSVSYNSNKTLHPWTGEDIEETPSVLTNFNTNIWQQTRKNSKASIKSLLSTSSTSTTQPSPLESPLESSFEQADPIERREWNIDEDASLGSSISMDGPSDCQVLVRGLAEIRKLRELSTMAPGSSIPRRYTADW